MLNPATKQQIVNGARLGLTLDGCARYVGLPPEVLIGWLRADADLRAAVEKAQGEREIEAVIAVQQRTKGWTAAAWFLERHGDPGYRRRRLPEATAPESPPGEMVDVLARDTEFLGRLRAALPEADLPPIASGISEEIVYDVEPRRGDLGPATEPDRIPAHLRRPHMRDLPFR